jgi:hypothetical protein
MKVRVFVREMGKKYEGGLWGSVPVEIEVLPRVGDHVAHQDCRELLRVDIVIVSTLRSKPHAIYVTKVDEKAVVEAAQKQKR